MSLVVVISFSRCQLYLKTLSSSGSVYPLSCFMFFSVEAVPRKRRRKKRKGKKKKGKEDQKKTRGGEGTLKLFFLRFKKKRYFNKVYQENISLGPIKTWQFAVINSYFQVYLSLYYLDAVENEKRERARRLQMIENMDARGISRLQHLG